MVRPRTFHYEIVAEETEKLTRAVHEEFCNPPSRHQQFAERLRQMPELVELRME